jgi:YD repeat-containing protein
MKAINTTRPDCINVAAALAALAAWLCLASLLAPVGPAFATSPSSTVLSTSASTATAAQSITLTATVSGASPSGTVSFNDGAATLGTGTLAAGVATLATSALGIGSHSLSAQYAGDASNDPSASAAVSVVITAGPMVWQYGYDAMGRMNSVIDPNGLASYTYYDSLGRAVEAELI